MIQQQKDQLMNTIDKVLLEWSLKTDKGYPDVNSKEDMDLFESMFGFKLNEEEEKEEDFTPITKVLTEARVPKQEISKTIEILKNGYLQAKNVKEFVEQYKTHIKTFKYLFPYKVARGGKGELIPFVSIKGARIGGGNEKDITDEGNKVLEVKAPTSATSPKISLASGGYIAGSDYLRNAESIARYLKNLPNQPELEFIYKDKQYYHPKASYLKNLENIFKNFPDIGEKVADKYNTFKLNGKLYALEKERTYSIKLDQENNLISTENSPKEVDVAKDYITRITNHPWVADSKNNSPIKDLNKVVKTAAAGIDYFLVYFGANPDNAAIIDANNELDKFTPYRVAQGTLAVSVEKPSKKREDNK